MNQTINTPADFELPISAPEALTQIDVAVGAVRLDILSSVIGVLQRQPNVFVRVVCAAPGFGIVPPEEAVDGLTLARQLTRAVSKAWSRQFLRVFGADVDDITKTNEWQRLIIELAGFVEKERLQIRFFDRELVGSQALVLHSLEGSVSLTASGGLDLANISRASELHSLQRGESAQEVARWFEGRWRESIPLSPQILEILRSSWACQLLSPTQAYHKAIIEFFSEMMEQQDSLVDDNPMLGQLANFQQDAYSHALWILKQYGGVFISDVVGLGKTYIGLALLRHVVTNQRAYPLIIAPPRLCGMWNTLMREYGVHAQVLSNHQLDKLHEYERCDLLLIDESHAFRNTRTNRYEQMMEFLRPDGRPSDRRMILLTATPQNNSCWDVYNQLHMFPDTYPPVPVDGEDLKDYFRKVEAGAENLSNLLQNVLVRRTRRLIKQEYPDATLPAVDDEGNPVELPIVFPERRDGPDTALRYSIVDVYDGLYDEILDTLLTLTYARYGLADYLHQECREMERYENLIRAGRSLRGLFKATLLKRCESSLEAFRKSLAWLIGIHEGFHTALVEHEIVATSPDHVGASIDDMDLEDVLALFKKQYPAADFDQDALQRDIEHDWYKLMELRARLDEIPRSDDAKLHRLREHLRDHQPGQHRTLLFSQFSDTAAYLYEGLKDLDCNVELITHGRGNQYDIMCRFAPKAMDAEVEPDEQIDLLISTDVLSEGVNLQDADTIINYDLHWNPVRLIQRAGRIDRIGSENDVIYLFNFLPEAALEDALGLEEVLRKRAGEIRRVFGSDGNILSERYDAHQMDEDEVIDTYTGKALREAESEEALDGLSRHRLAAQALKREHPDEYRRLSELRTSQRAIIAGGVRTILLAKAGWYSKFYEVSGEALESLTAEKALGTLERWRDARGWLKDTAVHGGLNRAMQLAEVEFEAAAAAVRQKRAQPVLSPAQNHVRERLLVLRQRSTKEETRRELDEMIDWLKRGRHRYLFEDHAKRWRRERLPAEAMRVEMRAWLRQHSEEEEELPDGEIVVGVWGA